MLSTPPPGAAELPLTVQLVSVAVPQRCAPPPLLVAELPLTVQLVSVTSRGGWPGHRRCLWTELPRTEQLVSMTAEKIFRPPCQTETDFWRCLV